MPIFRDFVDLLYTGAVVGAQEVGAFLPTVLRRTADNILALAQNVGAAQVLEASAQALEEYIDSWPIDTAAGWVLDQHWLPYSNLQRNGMSDAQARVFIHAKHKLNVSWGAANQALDIFHMLLPTAGLSFSPAYPKAWVINITGVPIADTEQALTFMRKNPSPAGGGFSVAGDNGLAVVSDAEVMSYTSVYGTVGVEFDVTGWFGSVYGAGGGVQAGYAHAQQI